MIRAVAVALALLWISPAAAESVRNKPNRYQLELPDGFDAVDTTAEGTVAAYLDKQHGIKLAIARVDYPNWAAWRKHKAFFESIESGVAAAASDYKRISKKRHKIGRVPAFDLWFSRRDKAGYEHVAIRFLFFRRYTVMLTAAMSDEAYKRRRSALKKLIGSFKTYFSS